MKLRTRILHTLLCLIVLFSCRKDEYRLAEIPKEPPLEQGSLVANLMQRTALKDGSDDNIIDKASCITVKLPVNLVVNGLQITVNTEDDYDTIEAIFDDSDTDTDTLVITFPITIILENFTEVLITSQTELNNYRNNCPDENEDDDDIECIDFNYPITFTTYNTLIDALGSETLNTDKELYEFIEAIEDYLVVNANFPIELILSDGTILSVDNLDELENLIEDAIDDCDEDDDDDFDDDDHVIVQTIQDFITLITQCEWKVNEFELNDQHLENQFNGYRFTFNTDGSTMAVNSSSTNFIGTWEVTQNNGLRFSILFNDFPDITKVWRVYEINPEDDGTRLVLRKNEGVLKLQQLCP